MDSSPDTTIDKVAVYDDRILQTKPKYAVQKGGGSVTCVPSGSKSWSEASDRTAS